MKKKSKLCVIAGAYGLGNLGDEAILQGLLYKLRKDDPCKRMIVFSHEPTETMQFHHVAAARRNLLDLIRSDEVVIGGGELLGHGMALKFAVLALVVKLLGKPVKFYSIGAASNIENRLTRFFTRLALNFAASEISVRDLLSKRQLKRLGVKKSISFEKCPSFYIRPAPTERGQNILEKEGIDINHRPLVGITFRLTYDSFKNKEILEFSLNSLRQILKNLRDAQIVFIPFAKHAISPQNLERDDLFGEWLGKMLNCNRFRVIRGQYTPSEIMSVIGCLDVEISMRLHPLIFATRMGTLCFGVNVYGKVVGYSTLLHYELVELEDVNKLVRMVNHWSRMSRKNKSVVS